MLLCVDCSSGAMGTGVRTMEYWDDPPMRREQVLLFCPTLDGSIGEDHPVRLFEEILRSRDWSAWEAEYDGTRGRPPIPPWVLAGLILYGLMRGARSSRMLEYLCTHNIDYLWLTEGRTIDYSTICKFRTRFREPLKDLFRQVGKLAMRMGLVRLLELGFDGTRVKANASRAHTWTAAKLEAALKELAAQFEQAMSETERADAADACMGVGDAGRLPPELATAEARRAKLEELLAEARAADATRQSRGVDPQKSPAQLPKADPESQVMPNKEGGYAPNYTPLAATDAAAGLIVDCDVVAEPREDGQTLATVDRIEEHFGQKPAAFLADTQHGTGVNLEGMEEREVEFYTPVESSVPGADNPAKREDPRQPVAEADWARLPRNDRKLLAKSCFVYDADADCYYCPMGRKLPAAERRKQERNAATAEIQVYRCRDCEGCVLSAVCRGGKAQRGRSVQRDQYEAARERMACKMQSPEGRAIYARRMHTAETPFGHIKRVMGVRQFLLRGLEKVRAEWMWACTAYNLKKLLSYVGALRAKLARMANGIVG
jgi:transposase